MPTPNYGIPLIAEGTLDPVQQFAQILNQIDGLLRVNQMPASGSLKFGDITNGRYVEVTGTGVTFHGDVEFGQNQARSFVIEKGTAFPSAPVTGQMFYRTDLTTLYVYTGAWTAMGAVTSTTVNTAGATMDSDFGAADGTILVKGATGVAPITPAAVGNEIPIFDAGVTAFRDIYAILNDSLTEGSVHIGGPGSSTQVLDIPLVSPDGQILIVDTASSGNLKWEQPSNVVASPLTAKGDLFIGTGAATGQVHAVPADNSVLLADAAQPTGWTSKAIGTAAGEILTAVAGTGGVALPALSAENLTNIPFSAFSVDDLVGLLNSARLPQPVVHHQALGSISSSLHMENIVGYPLTTKSGPYTGPFAGSANHGDQKVVLDVSSLTGTGYVTITGDVVDASSGLISSGISEGVTITAPGLWMSRNNFRRITALNVAAGITAIAFNAKSVNAWSQGGSKLALRGFDCQSYFATPGADIQVSALAFKNQGGRLFAFATVEDITFDYKGPTDNLRVGGDSRTYALGFATFGDVASSHMADYGTHFVAGENQIDGSLDEGFVISTLSHGMQNIQFDALLEFL